MYIDQTKYGGSQQNHEKLYFWSRDIIRVKNPLDRDFKFKYDSIWWTVPAGKTKDLERYLANRFCELMCQEIIGAMIIERAEGAIEDLSKKTGNLLYDKYLENQQVWLKMPKLDDPTMNAKVWKDLWLGVVERYGEEHESVQEKQDFKLDKDSNLYQKLAEEFGDIKFEDIVTPQPAQATQVVASEDAPPQEPSFAQEVTTNES